MSNNERSKIFTERVTAGSRHYFFDVKESQNGKKYLVISESRRSGKNYQHNRVMVFEENLKAFAKAFQKAAKFVQKKKTHRLFRLFAGGYDR
jgi:hypothetical protein